MWSCRWCFRYYWSYPNINNRGEVFNAELQFGLIYKIEGRSGTWVTLFIATLQVSMAAHGAVLPST